MAEDHAGKRLHFHVAQRVALDLREIADLLLREFDVFDDLLGKLAHAVLDFALAQAEVFRRPVVEFPRQVAHGCVAALLDVGEDVLDGLAYLGDVRSVLLGGNAGFQKDCHALAFQGMGRQLDHVPRTAATVGAG